MHIAERIGYDRRRSVRWKTACVRAVAIFSCAALLFFALAPTASAGVSVDDLKPWTWPGKALSFAAEKTGQGVLLLVDVVVDGVLALFWWIANGLAALLTFILYDFSQKVGFYDNTFVRTGWSLVRDIANWFFIVFLLIAAISTILDIPNYNARRVLPRLIVAALLVNFSLFFTTFFINVAQGFMSIFVSQLAGQYDDVGQLYLNGMGVQNAGSYDPDIGALFTDSIGEQARGLAAKLVAILFVLFAIYIFAFLTMALIYRFVILWVLIILSPIAFVGAALPATQAFWNRWFHDFTRWTVFAPIMTFFIWLGTYLLVYMNEIEPELTGFQTNPELTSGILQFAHRLVRYTVVVIFLYLSVRVARELANESAKAADRVGKAVTAGVGLAPVVVGGRAAQLGRVGLLRAGVPEKIGVGLQESPIAQRLRFPAYIGRQLTATKRAADIARWQRPEKTMEHFNVADLKRAARERGVAGTVAIHKLLEKNIPLEDERGKPLIDDALLEKHMLLAERLNQAGLMKTARADIALQSGVFKTEDQMNKHFQRLRPSDSAKIQAKSLEGKTPASRSVLSAVEQMFRDRGTPAHLNQIAGSDNTELFVTIQTKIVPKLAGDPRWKKFLTSPAGVIWSPGGGGAGHRGVV